MDPKCTTALKQEDSQVTKWLNENNAGEYAQKFFEKGFYHVEDLKEEDLKDLVPDDKPGIRSTLARLGKQEKDKQEKKKQEEEKERPRADIPKLPQHTEWDLSSRELTLRDDIKFEIPSALQVSADNKEVISPCNLTAEEWMVIARNCSLLHGRRMDGIVPVTADYPVLCWRVPDGNSFVRSKHLAAEVKSEVTYTEASSNYVRQGFSKITATASIPYCSGSAERESNERNAAAAKVQELFMTGIWHYPRARILLEECSVVSPKFVSDIMIALGFTVTETSEYAKYTNEEGEKKETFWKTKIPNREQAMGVMSTSSLDQKPDAAKEALIRIENILLKYGHVVGRSVDLGGQLFFVHHKRNTGSSNYQESKDVISAAVGIKTCSVAVEGGTTVGSGEARTKEAQTMAEQVSFTALGGDATLASTPQLWAATVKNPNLWAVINIAEVVSTVDLLPEPLRTLLHKMWRKYHRQGYLDGRVVRLRPWKRQNKCLLDVADEKNPPYLDGAVYKVPLIEEYKKYESASDPIWIIQSFQDDLYNIRHKRTDQILRCQHFPQASDAQAIKDVSGCVLTTFQPKASVKFRALWRIRPADPEGVYGDRFRETYFIENSYTDELLNSELRNNSCTFYSQAQSGYIDNITMENPDKYTGLLWRLEQVEDSGC